MSKRYRNEPQPAFMVALFAAACMALILAVTVIALIIVVSH